jgi:hypothetical protein
MEKVLFFELGGFLDLDKSKSEKISDIYKDLKELKLILPVGFDTYENHILNIAKFSYFRYLNDLLGERKSKNQILSLVQDIVPESRSSYDAKDDQLSFKTRFLNIVDSDFLSKMFSSDLSDAEIIKILESYKKAEKSLSEPVENFTTQTVLNKDYVLNIIDQYQDKASEVLKFILELLSNSDAKFGTQEIDVSVLKEFLANLNKSNDDFENILNILLAIESIPNRFKNLNLLNSIFERVGDIKVVQNIITLLAKFNFEKYSIKTQKIAQNWNSADIISSCVLDKSLALEEILNSKLALIRVCQSYRFAISRRFKK